MFSKNSKNFTSCDLVVIIIILFDIEFMSTCHVMFINLFRLFTG